MTIKPYTDEIARTMFVSTADGDYILARLAYFNALDLNFFWHSLHALEKYLKAILLMNGASARGYSHGLIELYDAVLRLDARLNFGPFIDPRVDGLHWTDESVSRFLERLNEYGSADNRYLTYGYSLRPEYLFKVDQLVWSVRRHCRPFRSRFANGENEIEIDEIEQLRNRPSRWTVGSILPVEKLINADESDPLRMVFLRLNTPFAPGSEHVLDGWRASSSNPPLAEWFRLLQAPDATRATRDCAAEVLAWAVDNIQFNRNDQTEIRTALEGYRDTVRRST